MLFLYSVTHTMKDRRGCATQFTQAHHRLLTSLSLCVAVIPMNDWRQVPASRPSLCSVPARQPRSNKKVAYFNRISLATETAAKIEVAASLCVLAWMFDVQALSKSAIHLEQSTLPCDTA